MSGFRRIPAFQLYPAGQEPLPFAFVAERNVDRHLLVDISPDREDFLLTSRIKDIREEMALASSTAEHWLYQVALNCKPPLRHRDSRSSRRLSTKTSATSSSCCTSNSLIEDEVTKRILSADGGESIPRHLHGTSSQEESISLFKELRLSTQDQLTSPRPLGPTHILVAYELFPRISPSTNSSSYGRRVLASRTHELPINDLLFALNVPNLRKDDGMQIRPLPRRKQNGLPRIMMAVPQLGTFPGLVVYLHNKNQAELFGQFVPGWVRDLMQPFPLAEPSSSVSTRKSTRKGGVLQALKGILRSAGKVNDSGSASPKWIEEYLELKLGEVVWMAQKMSVEGEVFVEAMALLNALRENLLHIGYFCRKLWFELDLTRELLLRTIVSLARV